MRTEASGRSPAVPLQDDEDSVELSQSHFGEDHTFQKTVVTCAHSRGWKSNMLSSRV